MLRVIGCALQHEQELPRLIDRALAAAAAATIDLSRLAVAVTVRPREIPIKPATRQRTREKATTSREGPRD